MMATKTRQRRKLNKSAAIREFLEANPSAMPNAVVTALGEKKITVSPTLVSNVKARMSGAKPGTRRRGRPPRSAGMLSVATLLEAKKFADHVGSVEAARQAIDALSKLQ
jgi:hypothetical protein